MSKKIYYICVKSTCGNTEIVVYAPSATKKCDKCGSQMKRES